MVAGKVAGGAFAGAVLFAVGEGRVSAHESLDTDETSIDLDKGETVWGEVIEAGVPESRIPELLLWYKASIPNLPDFSSMPTGYRLPIPLHFLEDTSSKSIDLDKGETVWGEAVKAGVPESEIPELVKWLEDVTPRMANPNKLPVGFTFSIPTEFLSGPSEIVPAGTSSLPGLLVIEQGSTIIGALEEHGAVNPAAVVDMVIAANNGIIPENIQPGTEIVIPAGILPAETPDSWSPIVTPEPAVSPESTSEVTNNTEQSVPDAPVVPVPEASPTERVESVVGAQITPSSPEILSSPEIMAYKIIMDSLHSNNGIMTPEAAAQAYEYVSMLPRHSEGDPEFPFANEFIAIPAPTADIPFVVHPNTCTEELYARPSAILSSLLGVAVHEWTLMLPENAMKRNSVYEFGDKGSGDHKRHGTGQATDDRSRIIDAPATEYPEGYVFNILSPNYDPEFTKSQLVLQLLARAPDGGYLVDHIEFYDQDVIKEVNSILFELGRTDAPMKNVRGHSEHIHKKTRLIGYENPDATAGPNTTSRCDYAYLNLDPMIIQEVMARRALYPVPEVEALTVTETSSAEAPVTEVIPEVVTEASTYWVISPEYKELVANSSLSESRKEYFLMITEMVMKKYNEGANIPPRATIAMAMWEGGWGEGRGVREGNNPFSHKVSRSWAAEHPDEVVWIHDDEFDDQNNKIPSPFRMYPSVEAALDAHIELISNSRYGQYEDSEKCRMDDRDFLIGLINELRRDCSIGKLKGEEGVLSYATGDNYVDKLYGLVDDSVISQIILLNPDEAQRRASQEWVDYYAA